MRSSEDYVWAVFTSDVRDPAGEVHICAGRRGKAKVGIILIRTLWDFLPLVGNKAVMIWKKKKNFIDRTSYQNLFAKGRRNMIDNFYSRMGFELKCVSDPILIVDGRRGLRCEYNGKMIRSEILTGSTMANEKDILETS